MESSDSEDPFSSDDEEADANWRPEGELSDIEDLNDYVMQVEKNVVIDEDEEEALAQEQAQLPEQEQAQAPEQEQELAQDVGEDMEVENETPEPFVGYIARDLTKWARTEYPATQTPAANIMRRRGIIIFTHLFSFHLLIIVRIIQIFRWA